MNYTKIYKAADLVVALAEAAGFYRFSAANFERLSQEAMTLGVEVAACVDRGRAPTQEQLARAEQIRNVFAQDRSYEDAAIDRASDLLYMSVKVLQGELTFVDGEYRDQEEIVRMRTAK